MSLRDHRRTILKYIGAGVGASLIGSVAAGSQDGAEAPYSIVQGDTCVPVYPLEGTESAAAFYDWEPNPEHRWSSNGTTHLQREDTSLAFLYRSPAATSLIFVHGKVQGTGDGGSLSVEVFGLPLDGEWVVEDDNYDHPNNYDVWTHAETSSQIHWTWDGGRTDGGVFEGMTADATVRVIPHFNEEAALYGNHYDGTVEDWQFLSWEDEDVRRIQLDMDEPLTIQGGGCPTDSTSGSGGDEDSTSNEDGDEAENDRRKHERKQQKHREKHQRKQEKHREKHQRKQEKHREKHQRKQEKHEEKEEREREKHERKQEKHEEKEQREREKHERKQQKHRRKHERKQRKHEEKEDEEEEEEDD